MKQALIFLFCCTILTIGCSDDKSTDDITECDTQNITYTEDISVILQSCDSPGCHGTASLNGSLKGFDDAIYFSSNYSIIDAIKHQNGASPMPQGGEKLSDCNITKIETWIDNGFPY
jgi:hypothetical protein